MVASSVVVPAVPPVTRLPGVTRRSPMRPATGARSSVNSRSSSACRTAASFAGTDASALRLACARCSNTCSVMVLSRSELLAAREVGLGEGEVRARQREIGARLVERVLERPLVDGEQQVALLDDLAVVEMHAFEIAGHAGAHLDAIDRDEAADIFVLVDDVALHRLRHRHGRRRRRLLRALAVAAGGEHGSEEHKKEGGSAD